MEPHGTSLWQSTLACRKEEAQPDDWKFSLARGRLELCKEFSAKDKQFTPAISIRQDWPLPRSLVGGSLTVIVIGWVASTSVSVRQTPKNRRQCWCSMTSGSERNIVSLFQCLKLSLSPSTIYRRKVAYGKTLAIPSALDYHFWVSSKRNTSGPLYKHKNDGFQPMEWKYGKKRLHFVLSGCKKRRYPLCHLLSALITFGDALIKMQ